MAAPKVGTFTTGLVPLPAENVDTDQIVPARYLQVIDKGLKVMDSTAITLCMDNRLPIIIFNLRMQGNLRRVVMGEAIGSIVTA